MNAAELRAENEAMKAALLEIVGETQECDGSRAGQQAALDAIHTHVLSVYRDAVEDWNGDDEDDDETGDDEDDEDE